MKWTRPWRRFWEGQPHNPFQRGIVKEIGSGEWLGCARVLFPERGNLLSWWLNFAARKTQDDKDWWIPDLGELVACLVDENFENGVILCALYSTADTPPANATVDQYIKQFSDGAVIKYDRSTHTLTATLPSGGTADVTAPGGLTITATGGINLNGLKIDATGNVNGPGTATFTGEGTFNGGHTVSQHTHPDPQGGSTGTPTG